MVRAGYKQTEIGEIPEDWEVRTFDQVCDVRDGTHESPKAQSDGVPFVTSKNITFGRLDFKDIIYISSEDAVEINKRSKVDVGDILMSMIGSLGNIAAVYEEPNFCIKNVALLKPKTISQKFLYQWMVGSYFQKLLSDSLDGGIQKFISLGNLRKLTLLLPSDPEQKAIATALSDVDGLIGALEKQIAKKRDIKTATMQQLLTGKKRLPGFGEGKGYKQTELGLIPEDWEPTAMGELVEFINGRAYGLHEWEEQGTPVIRLQNLTGRGENYYYSNLELPEKQYCNNGDLLFMWSATFGPVFWKGEKAIYHYHIWKIACTQKIEKHFLYYKLDEMTENLKRRSSSGGTMLHVTKEKMETTKIASPVMEEQTAIANVLVAMDNELEVLVTKFKKTKSIKQGMMQELLTGRTRLI